MATTAPSLVLIKWRGLNILTGQELVYRPTTRPTDRPTYRPSNSCKTICSLFQGGIKMNLMLCAKFEWKCPNGSGKEIFKKFSIMSFHYFAIISTLRRAWPFIWKKTPTNWIIFIQGYFVPSFVENGTVVLEKKICTSSQCIFTTSQLSPLWEGCGPSFDQTWIPLIQECFVPCLMDIGPVVLEKKIY